MENQLENGPPPRTSVATASFTRAQRLYSWRQCALKLVTPQWSSTLTRFLKCRITCLQSLKPTCWPGLSANA
eukprot:scaffold163193_cov20-Prasinocladus_malaysianus.AAC.1